MLKVSVLIPTKDRAQDLKICLDSLVRQIYKNFEVVIVDNSNSAQTQELCRNYGSLLNIKYIIQKRKGFTGAVLDGLDLVEGDIFTRTDDDVVADENWLNEVVRVFASSESIGGVTGPALIPEDRLERRDLIKFNLRLKNPSNILDRFLKIIYHDFVMEGEPFGVSRFFKSGAFSLGSGFRSYLEKIDDLKDVDYLESCNWSVRKELLDKIGGFDAQFIGVGDYFEADAAYKIKGSGFRLVFSKRAKIQHLVSIGGSFGSRSNSYARSRNFVLFYYRHIRPNTPDKALRFFTYLALMNAYFLLSFFKTANTAHLSGIYGTLDGLMRYIPELWRTF